MPRSNKSICSGTCANRGSNASLRISSRANFRVAQVDHDAGAIGGLDSRAFAERIAQTDRPGCGCALRVVRL
jgi:hypothetical protein